MTTLRNLSLAGVLGLTVLTAGCSLLEGDSSRSDRDRDRDRDGVILSSDRDRDRDRDRNVERESGASRGVPRDARVVDEGRGGTLSYSTRDEGTVYLVDETAGAVVWDQRVRDGDRITVDPDKNAIEVNGRSATKLDLKSNNRFALYFLRR